MRAPGLSERLMVVSGSLAAPLCRRRGSLQPDEAFDVVDEVGEPDLEPCPRESDGSDEEAHSVLLLGKLSLT